MISRQSLAKALSGLKPFSSPEVFLEQYTTPGDLAAELLHTAALRGNMAGKRVIDLGAGTGILAIGSALLGAEDVFAVEKDPKAVEILRENSELYEGTDSIVVVQGSVGSFQETGDVVVMNPPFGTKERHADRLFLERAVELAPVIYTIHKSSTEGFVHAFCKDFGYLITMEERRRFPIARTMAHHKKDVGEVAVTLFCLERNNFK